MAQSPSSAGHNDDSLATRRTERARPRPRKFEREYSPDELLLFARYLPNRAAHQPPQCTRGEACWVRCGPPCYRASNGPGGHCVECKGTVQ